MNGVSSVTWNNNTKNFHREVAMVLGMVNTFQSV